MSANLNDEEEFLHNQETLMRTLGALVLRAGGTLTLPIEELNSMDDMNVHFEMDHAFEKITFTVNTHNPHLSKEDQPTLN